MFRLILKINKCFYHTTLVDSIHSKIYIRIFGSHQCSSSNLNFWICFRGDCLCCTGAVQPDIAKIYIIIRPPPKGTTESNTLQEIRLSLRLEFDKKLLMLYLNSPRNVSHFSSCPNIGWWSAHGVMYPIPLLIIPTAHYTLVNKWGQSCPIYMGGSFLT